VSIDNCTAATATILQICCRDRKGLLYDLMRTLKDNSLRVTYAKVPPHSASLVPALTCEAGEGEGAMHLLSISRISPVVKIPQKA
jgi:hypothetical protein